MAQKADFNVENQLKKYAHGRDQGSYLYEIQHVYKYDPFHMIYGISHFDTDIKDLIIIGNNAINYSEKRDHQTFYGYLNIHYPENITWIIGSSIDIYDADKHPSCKQWNPKAGIVWQPMPKTTVRASAFRALKRSLLSNQTIEPTQVGGFNQFYDDPEATDSKRSGFGIDQQISKNISAGIEVSDRDLDVPVAFQKGYKTIDWDERLARGYLTWNVGKLLSGVLECQYEKIERDAGNPELFTEVETLRLPLSLNVFHPSGVRTSVKGTYVHQNGIFNGNPGKDRFMTLDAKIGYQFPNQLARISIEAKNLMDEEFHFQDTDGGAMEIYPEQTVIAKMTISF